MWCYMYIWSLLSTINVIPTFAFSVACRKEWSKKIKSQIKNTFYYFCSPSAKGKWLYSYGGWGTYTAEKKNNISSYLSGTESFFFFFVEPSMPTRVPAPAPPTLTGQRGAVGGVGAGAAAGAIAGALRIVMQLAGINSLYQLNKLKRPFECQLKIE